MYKFYIKQFNVKFYLIFFSRQKKRPEKELSSPTENTERKSISTAISIIHDHQWTPQVSEKALYIYQDSKLLALLNWFRLVYGPSGQRNMHCTIHPLTVGF